MSTVNKTELGEILGKSQTTLTTWAKNGMPIEAVSVRGKAQVYDTAEVIDWMLKRERDKYLLSDNEELDLQAERARLTKAQADNEELKFKEKKGELIPSEAVEHAWLDHVTAARSVLLALPTKLAPVAMAAKTIREVENFARDEVFHALDQLAAKGETDGENSPKSH